MVLPSQKHSWGVLNSSVPVEQTKKIGHSRQPGETRWTITEGNDKKSLPVGQLIGGPDDLFDKKRRFESGTSNDFEADKATLTVAKKRRDVRMKRMIIVSLAL